MNRRINIELAKEKQLIIGDNNTTYMKLENLYKYLFEVYLSTKINFKDYDDKIVNSNLFFKNPGVESVYLLNNLREYFGLNYIYVMNNFFIEKLDMNDITTLKNIVVNSNIKVTDELLSLIERTYRDIIKDNYKNGNYNDNRYNVCYGVALPDNFAYNDAIVLKIFYSHNFNTINDNEQMKSIINRQDEFIKKLKVNIEEDIKNKISVPCVVLVERV